MSLFKRIVAVLLGASLGAGVATASNVTGTVALPNTSLRLANGTFSLTLNQSAIAAGTFSITASTVNCYTSSDGTVVGIPNSLASPTAAAQAAAGSLSGTYSVKVTYYGSGVETLASPTRSVLVTGPNNSILVTAPTLHPATATGYKVYAGLTVGSETLQATTSGWGTTTLNALVSGAALPSSNTSVCSLAFNDTLIPTGTKYRVNLVDANGTQVAGFPQDWALYGSSVDVTNGYPIAPANLQTRFPNPILQNPSSNAQQSVSSPVTLNGYALTAGSLLLPNNAAPPATSAGRTVIYTDNSGVAKICQNGAACVNLLGSSGGWSLNGTDILESVITNSVVLGAASSDLTTQGGGVQQGVAVAPYFYAVSAATNARVAAIGKGTGNTMTIASGVSGTQTTGWPLQFKVCPAAGDCSALGTTEAGRVETGGRWILGLGASASSDYTGGNVISVGSITEVNSAANAVGVSMYASGGGGGQAIVEGVKSGAAAYPTLALWTNGSEALRADLTHNVLLGVTTADNATSGILEALRSQDNPTYALVRNATDGVLAYSAYKAVEGASGGANMMEIGVTSPSYTPVTSIGAEKAFWRTTATNGFALNTATGTYTFAVGGTNILTIASTGLSTTIPLKQTAGGTGQSSAIANTRIVYSDGTAYQGSASFLWNGDNEVVTGGLLLATDARVNPATGTYLHAFYDSGTDNGNVLSYNYTGAAYKNLKLSGLAVTLNANGTDVVTVKSGLNVNIRLASVPVYANNAAAIAGGLAAGDLYRTNADPDPLEIVH